MPAISVQKASQDNATVQVSRGGTTKTFDLAYLKTFDKVTFDATLDTSKTGPEVKSFGGVPLVSVLKDLGLSLDGASLVTFKAADGYASVVTALEAGDSENVYLVYERSGNPQARNNKEEAVRLRLSSARISSLSAGASS